MAQCYFVTESWPGEGANQSVTLPYILICYPKTESPLLLFPQKKEKISWPTPLDWKVAYESEFQILLIREVNVVYNIFYARRISLVSIVELLSQFSYCKYLCFHHVLINHTPFGVILGSESKIREIVNLLLANSDIVLEWAVSRTKGERINCLVQEDSEVHGEGKLIN